jgi:hypothetical protein
MRRIIHRVAQAPSEYGAKARTWLMTQLYSCVQAHRNNWPLHNCG